METTKKLSLSLFILFLTLSVSLQSVSLQSTSAQSTATTASVAITALTCVSINQNIYSGVSGNEVKKLQRFLFEKGYLPTIPKANKFGPATVAAVKKFQSENNLIVTGNIGKVSRDKIKEVSCGGDVTKTTVISLNDTNLAASSGPNIKFNGVIKIDDKMTFTQDQLAKFKSDVSRFYLKYKDKDKNIEPFKTEGTKELESIFLKDLGVEKAVTKNFGIFMYPEIGSILSEVQKQYPEQRKAITAPATSTNSIVLSDINPSVVSISEIDKYIKTPLTFKVTNDILVKQMCRKEYLLDNKGTDIFGPSMYCDGYIAKNGVYSDVYFFTNFKSVISGTYETRNGHNYFENEGIYSKVIDFYAKDKDGAESNYIRLTFTR